VIFAGRRQPAVQHGPDEFWRTADPPTT
jgi:hypothetical protein